MSGSKHARSTRLRRSPVQNARYAAVTQDSALLQNLMLRLWAALPPGSTPAGGEKLGKIGKRSASPAGVNVAVHDLLVEIVTGVTDLVMRARDLLDDIQPPERATTALTAAARQFAALPAAQQTPKVLAAMRRGAWSEAYMTAWSGARKPRSNEDYRQAYGALKFLPGLLDRLQGLEDGEALARRIEHDLARWIRAAQRTSRPGTVTLDECPLVYDGVRPCGEWDGRRWHPGMLMAYTGADWSQGRVAEDVWCTGCGTRWTPAEYAELVVTLADKEAG